ncbi:MAG: IS1595 family transposase, partial [Clostridia bacterium]
RGEEKQKAIVALSMGEKNRATCLKLRLVEDFKGKTFGEFANGCIARGSDIRTDVLRSYRKTLTKKHLSRFYVTAADKETKKWLNIIVNNAKALIVSTFHGLDKKHLQAYFNEFCYRFNLRHSEIPIFDYVTRSTMRAKPFPFTELTE